jgi:hypothetical protein
LDLRFTKKFSFYAALPPGVKKMLNLECRILDVECIKFGRQSLRNFFWGGPPQWQEMRAKKKPPLAVRQHPGADVYNDMNKRMEIYLHARLNHSILRKSSV